MAQAVGVHGLQDEDYTARSRTYTRETRIALQEALAEFPQLKVYPSQANYLLLRLKTGTARSLAGKLLRHKIAIRTFAAGVLADRFFRIAVRSKRDNHTLLDTLVRIWPSKPQSKTLPGLRRRRTPAVMFQGSGSNVGKSIMAAAMCRVLLQDGYRVAPFKAQNMSLNAFATRDGKEMARAQVVQAQACRLEPDWRMNPILLKPSGNMKSQVIFCGEPQGHQAYGAYRHQFAEIQAEVHRIYDQFAADHQVMVLEGAGSPGEVNLKDRDLVNMPMSAKAEAAVVLVGDIDRGGVFASFMGTMTVLAERERALVAGYLINRFRGDARLLADALNYLERYTGRGTFGVMPFLEHLGLPEEDSVGFRQNVQFRSKPQPGRVDIAVIDLPHIANFTDFDPFVVEEEVNLRLVKSIEELGRPHVVIIPGSKQMSQDMSFLVQTGLAQRIKEFAQSDVVELVGLCGGLQMLGREARDGARVESERTLTKGFGFLPIVTTWQPGKITRQTTATHQVSGLRVSGYEIHHGRSEWAEATPLFISSSGQVVGVTHAELKIWGTYLHGLFENDAFRRWWIDRIRQRQGLQPSELPLRPYNLEPALDRLADVFRAHVDVAGIYRAMRLQ